MNQRRTMRLVIAVIFSIGFFTILGCLMWVEIPTGNRDVLMTLLGALGGAVITILTYFFGDSQGHDDNQGETHG